MGWNSGGADFATFTVERVGAFFSATTRGVEVSLADDNDKLSADDDRALSSERDDSADAL